jgi:hypothetical protein
VKGAFAKDPGAIAQRSRNLVGVVDRDSRYLRKPYTPSHHTNECLRHIFLCDPFATPTLLQVHSRHEPTRSVSQVGSLA